MKKLLKKEKQEMREIILKITKGKNWKTSKNEDENSESNIS